VKNRKETSFRPGDGVAVALILCAAAALWFFLLAPPPSEGPRTVQVWQDGQMLRELPLTENAEFTLTGAYTNRVMVLEGRVRIAESTCPGEDCVHTGWIDQAGRSIVCLPNRVEIRVTDDGSEHAVDAVVR